MRRSDMKDGYSGSLGHLMRAFYVVFLYLIQLTWAYDRFVILLHHRSTTCTKDAASFYRRPACGGLAFPAVWYLPPIFRSKGRIRLSSQGGSIIVSCTQLFGTSMSPDRVIHGTQRLDSLDTICCFDPGHHPPLHYAQLLQAAGFRPRVRQTTTR